MELTFACPQCSTINRQGTVETADAIACASCGTTRPIHPAAFDDAGLAACPQCGTTDLYLQKDFPQNLGVAIVIVGFVISSIFWYYERPLITYGILLASALLDMVLYYRVPTVTICYRCLGQIRGERANPGDDRFQGFDLSIGERYRQERIRIQELRERSAAKAAGTDQPSRDSEV